MSWLQRYRARLYFRNSMWVIPAVGSVLGWFVVAFVARLERRLGWEMQISLDTARIAIGTMAASMFSLVVVICSATLVAVQLASAQLTPRIISFIYRSRSRKVVIGIFAFTFTFSLSYLLRIEGTVPLVTSYVAAAFFLINLVLFLYFIDGIGKALRPSAALHAVALTGRDSIRDVYPQALTDTHPRAAEPLIGEPTRSLVNLSDGVVLAFDLKGLVSLAERANCVIELVPEVGDFVAAGDPLFRIFGNGRRLSDQELRNSVALGQERTMEQDPMFAFRIMVDIASKALSPAVNDPTTAVLAIDQIHHLLRDVGGRYLAEGRERDANGNLRLAYPTPNWEDFVSLAVTEIRQYGATSVQVTRRLRALLENLIVTLPERRIEPLKYELALLQSAIEHAFVEPGDRVRASVSDLQGIGGGTEQLDRHEPLRSEADLRTGANRLDGTADARLDRATSRSA